MKKDQLKTSYIYHIFNKSIAGYEIFKTDESYRFIQILSYYNIIPSPSKLSYRLNSNQEVNTQILLPSENQIVKFICYCIMPTHYHLLVKILKDEYISHFLNTIGNAYTRYFNTKADRKGPLWQSPFQAVRIKTNEQLLHVSRYIHLNPTTANLVKNPEDWKFSSYKQYISDKRILEKIMTEISIKSPGLYRKFVENQKDYQKKLKTIQKLLLE